MVVAGAVVDATTGRGRGAVVGLRAADECCELAVGCAVVGATSGHGCGTGVGLRAALDLSLISHFWFRAPMLPAVPPAPS